MKTAIILHDLIDARHCVKNKLYLDSLLFSTHTSVDVYLKEVHNIECECLSRYVSYQEAKSFQSDASIKVDQILNLLDAEVSGWLNERTGIKINYFASLYGYFGKFQFFGYLSLANGIRNVIKAHGIEKIRFYQYNFNKFFATSQKAEDFLEKLFSDAQAEVINYDKRKFNSCNLVFWVTLRKLFRKLHKLCIDPGAAFRKILKVIFGQLKPLRRLNPEKKTLIFSEPLYELDYLIDSRSFNNKFNIFNYAADQGAPIRFRGKRSMVSIDLSSIDRIFDTLVPQDPVSFLFFEDIKTDFMSKVHSYINSLNLLDAISNSSHVALGVWGVPPVSGLRALIYEYLRRKSIKVVGCQHGASYGETYYPWHFDSDFTRCDYFISYGFTQENLRALYPDRDLPSRVFPFGKINLPDSYKKNNEVDILFPIIQSTDIFSGGMLRTFPHEINDSQIKILQYLDSLGNLKVMVKPFAGARSEDCSMLILKKRFKNIIFVENLALTQFLKSCLPKIVVFEYPSTGVYEVANLDSEIFLIKDKFNLLSKDAFLKLDGRVHFSEDADGLIKNLDLFLSGELESKRNGSFFNSYVYKNSAAENTASFIEGLAMGKTL